MGYKWHGVVEEMSDWLFGGLQMALCDMVRYGTVWYGMVEDYLLGYRSPSEVYSMQRRRDHLMALIIFNVTQLEVQQIHSAATGVEINFAFCAV